MRAEAEAAAGGKMAARRGPGPVAVLALLALLGPGWPLRGARAVLNLQELSELKYGLEILAEPVLAGQVRRGTGDNGWVGGKRERPAGPTGTRAPAMGLPRRGASAAGQECQPGASTRIGSSCPSTGHRPGAVPGPGYRPVLPTGARTGAGGRGREWSTAGGVPTAARDSRSGRERDRRHRVGVMDAVRADPGLGAAAPAGPGPGWGSGHGPRAVPGGAWPGASAAGGTRGWARTAPYLPR